MLIIHALRLPIDMVIFFLMKTIIELEILRDNRNDCDDNDNDVY
jgi:hypothetical protein